MAANNKKSDIDIARDYDGLVQPKLVEALKSVHWAAFTLLKEDDGYVLKVETRETNHTNSAWVAATASLKATFQKLTSQELRVDISPAKTYMDLHLNGGIEQAYDHGSSNPFGVYSLGRSIGVGQLDKPGTLGGFITISTNEWCKVYGLTNNHVINVHSIGNKQDEDPKFLHDGNEIYSPGAPDLRATVSALGQTDPEITNVKLGHLSMASGRTLHKWTTGDGTYCMLDWALIELDLETLENMRSKNPGLKPNFQMQRSPVEKRRNSYPDSISYNPRAGLRPDLRVYKWGRTTGVSRGMVQLSKRTMTIEEAQILKGSIQYPEGIKSIEEFVVYPGVQGPFCEGGDSGSFVVDEDDQLVGLLHAKALLSDETLVTDIRVVFASISASIREKFGLDVTEIKFSREFPSS